MKCQLSMDVGYSDRCEKELIAARIKCLRILLAEDFLARCSIKLPDHI